MEIDRLKHELGKTFCAILDCADRFIDAKPNISRVVLADDDYKSIAYTLNQYCVRNRIKRRGIIFYRGKQVISFTAALSISPEGVQHERKQQQ